LRLHPCCASCCGKRPAYLETAKIKSQGRKGKQERTLVTLSDDEKFTPGEFPFFIQTTTGGLELREEPRASNSALHHTSLFPEQV